MSCCTARFNTDEERRSVVDPAAIRTWRMRERLAGRDWTLEAWLRAHDVCRECRGYGKVYDRTLLLVTKTCPHCSGSGYYRELPTLLVICSYCKREMGRKPCVPKMAGEISHGCCPDCIGRMRETMGLAYGIKP